MRGENTKAKTIGKSKRDWKGKKIIKNTSFLEKIRKSVNRIMKQ